MGRLQNHELRAAEKLRSEGPSVEVMGYRFEEIMKQPQGLAMTPHRDVGYFISGLIIADKPLFRPICSLGRS